MVACLRHKWMPQHGVSAFHLLDNGPHFVLAVLREFCASVEIRMLYDTPYHPQGNGVVERLVPTLKKASPAL